MRCQVLDRSVDVATCERFVSGEHELHIRVRHVPQPIWVWPRRQACSRTANRQRQPLRESFMTERSVPIPPRAVPSRLMRWRVGTLAVVWAMWLLSLIALGWRLASDANNYFGGPCEIPGADSDYGSASWSLWPPGETCRDHSGHIFRHPSDQRSILLIAGAVGLVLIPTMTIAVVRVDRARQTESEGSLGEFMQEDEAAR